MSSCLKFSVTCAGTPRLILLSTGFIAGLSVPVLALCLQLPLLRSLMGPVPDSSQLPHEGCHPVPQEGKLRLGGSRLVPRAPRGPWLPGSSLTPPGPCTCHHFSSGAAHSLLALHKLRTTALLSQNHFLTPPFGILFKKCSLGSEVHISALAFKGEASFWDLHPVFSFYLLWIPEVLLLSILWCPQDLWPHASLLLLRAHNSLLWGEPHPGVPPWACSDGHASRCYRLHTALVAFSCTCLEP